MNPPHADNKGFLPRLPWLLAAAYFLFFSSTSFFMYRHLLYRDQDLAIHAQTMWNLVHGSGFSSILGVHIFANHFIPFYYFLRYVYYFFQTPMFLLLLQSAALASGVVFSYRLARRQLSPWMSLLLALAYFFYPPIGYTNLYEFHQTSLAVPFLFMMILGYAESRFLLFSMGALLAMSLQENIPMAVFMMAVLASMDRKKAHWIAVPAVLSVGWIAVGVGLIKPRFNKGFMEMFSIYSYLGKTPADALRTLVFHPTSWINSVFTPQAMRYLFQVLAPLLFLPLVGWRFFLPVVPFIFQHLLSTRAVERTVHAHYVIEMVPFLAAAAAAGTAKLLERYPQRVVRYALAAGFAVSFVCTSILISPYTQTLDLFENFFGGRALTFQKKLMARIPKEASAAATLSFLTPLSQRREIYSLHHAYWGHYSMSSVKYVLPEFVEYALIDLKDPITFNFDSPDRRENLKAFFSRSWRVMDFAQDTILLRKGPEDWTPLFKVYAQDAPAPVIPLKASANGEIELAGIDFKAGTGDHDGHVGIVFHWKCLKKPQRNYSAFLTVVDSRGRTLYEYDHFLCYRVRPTTRWEADDTVIENFWFIMPAGAPREPLELRLSLIDKGKEEVQALECPMSDRLTRDGRLKLDTLEPS